jgi:hypothetical protein
MSRLREQRIDRYLAIAACAGAGGIAATNADAAIVRSDLGWSATVQAPEGSAPFVKTFGPGAGALDNVFEFVAGADNSTRGVAFNSAGPARLVRGSRLASGDTVGSVMPGAWADAAILVQSVNSGGFTAATTYAQWGQLGGTVGDSLRGFIGFRFTSGADTFYGYFEITVFRTGTDSSSKIGFTVHGWAYNDQAGQAITIGPPTVIPGGAGLAALAFGAAGLRGRRRSRN